MKNWFLYVLVFLSIIILLFLSIPLLKMIFGNDLKMLMETLKQKDVIKILFCFL